MFAPCRGFAALLVPGEVYVVVCRRHVPVGRAPTAMPPSQQSLSAPARQGTRFPGRSGLLHDSAAWFLGALVALMISAPFLQHIVLGAAVESTFLLLLLTAAVLAVGGRRWTLTLAVLLATPVLAARWLYFAAPAWVPHEVFLASFLLFVAFVIAQFLWFILHAPRVNSEVLCAAVSTYLLLGLWWAIAYGMAARLSPECFIGATGATRVLQDLDAVYFSFITITTVGYGDITPASSTTRMLAMTEAITGTMYMAVLVARLVSLYTMEAASKSAEPDKQA